MAKVNAERAVEYTKDRISKRIAHWRKLNDIEMDKLKADLKYNESLFEAIKTPLAILRLTNSKTIKHLDEKKKDLMRKIFVLSVTKETLSQVVNEVNKLVI
jgi:hypothetical protein